MPQCLDAQANSQARSAIMKADRFNVSFMAQLFTHANGPFPPFFGVPLHPTQTSLNTPSNFDSIAVNRTQSPHPHPPVNTLSRRVAKATLTSTLTQSQSLTHSVTLTHSHTHSES